MPFPSNYSQTEPCPICGRYKSAYKNKCHGFITSDGVFAYCSREIPEGQVARTVQTFYGKTLYRHKLGAPLRAATKITTDAIPSTVSQPTTKKTPKRGRKKTFTKSLQSEKKPWDSEGNMAELERIIRQYRLAGKWPY